ncbi:MAG: class I SAM-dependent methyltransferase [Planctomycetota bacterium]
MHEHEREALRAKVRGAARDAVSRGEPLAWFEELYRAEAAGELRLPWANFEPTPQLVAWIGPREPRRGARALVVGCGFGDDAAFLAGRGFATTAFDVAPTAIERARSRFRDLAIEFEVADLLHPPASWRRAFDLVVEVYTLQALPTDVQRRAIDALSELVAPGGQLFVCCRGRDEDEPVGEVPWPLAACDLARFESRGLVRVSFEDAFDDEEPPVRRFVAVYARETG